MRYLITSLIIFFGTTQLFAKNKLKSSIGLWKFPTQYRYLNKKNIQNTSILINLNCESEKDCIALLPKEKKIKMSKKGGANPIALLCERNNGKVQQGVRKKQSALFCQFKDGSLIELRALPLL